MIDTGQYKKILDEGLLLDHYALLCNIRDGKELVNSKRIQGFINLLCKKEYIEDGALTQKALDLLSCEPAKERAIVKFEPTKEEIQVDGEFDYAKWVIRLHKVCQDKLLSSKGKRQVRANIKGNLYSYLPNSTDLGKVIERAINTYKLKDFNKIQKTILAYVDRCIKTDQWTPLLNYYIMKDGMSPMVTDMDAVDEIERDDDTIVNI